MRKIIKKLKGRAGETLVESIAAILVFTLSSIALLSMISAAADINRTAKTADKEYREQMVYVEKAEKTDSTSGRVTFYYDNDPVAQDDVYICQESNNSDALYAYYLDSNPTAEDDAS